MSHGLEGHNGVNFHDVHQDVQQSQTNLPGGLIDITSDVRPDDDQSQRKSNQPPPALSLLAGLCAAADHTSNYPGPPRAQTNVYTHPAYVLPPESPSMPALIPVTTSGSPPHESSQHPSNLVFTAFQAMQHSGHMVPNAYDTHTDPHHDILNKSSW